MKHLLTIKIRQIKSYYNSGSERMLKEMFSHFANKSVKWYKLWKTI